MSERLKKVIPYSILFFIILFNFYLYRTEFNVLLDPNDNIFQYALVDEAKKILHNIISGKLSPFYLLDSFNERWAQGFPLSLYYAHLPQAAISLIGLISPIGIYKTFVILRTLLLIFMPIMFFLGGRVLGFRGYQVILAAFFSQVIFTDGLYGIDASSFLWRGWGLSAQLMAVFFLPLAFAYGIRYLGRLGSLGNSGDLLKAVIFNYLVAQSHFGIFLFLSLAYLVFWGVWGFWESVEELKSRGKIRLISFIGRIRPITKRSIVLFGLLLLSLAYFIIPFFLQGAYRNYSVWDPIWKFDSWGARQIIIWFLQGNLFDFGRLPILSFTILFGVIWGFREIGERGKSNDTREAEKKMRGYLSLLFVFFFVLFLGRTSLGKLIDFIPGFSEYHLHRIILMVQFIGVFIASDFVLAVLGRLGKLGILAIVLVGMFYLERPVVKYAKENASFIDRANATYLKEKKDYKKIRDALSNLPRARIYAGKPGNWGRNQWLGETPLYMVLSQDGFPVIGFLPESWSPNSDIEQFFSDGDLRFYQLFNVGYMISPSEIKPPDFMKLVLRSGKYNLYKVPQEGWFSFGRSSLIIKSEKTNLLNIQRFWFTSYYFANRDYPKIGLGKGRGGGRFEELEGKRIIEMIGLNRYKLDDGVKNIWEQNPLATDDSTDLTDYWIRRGESSTPKGYTINFKLKKDCKDCIVLLKQSFHPNWKISVNDQPVKAFPVFPFYIGIAVEKSGDYRIEALYKPSSLKSYLFLGSLGILAGLGILGIRRRFVRPASS